MDLRDDVVDSLLLEYHENPGALANVGKTLAEFQSDISKSFSYGCRCLANPSGRSVWSVFFAFGTVELVLRRLDLLRTTDVLSRFSVAQILTYLMQEEVPTFVVSKGVQIVARLSIWLWPETIPLWLNDILGGLSSNSARVLTVLWKLIAAIAEDLSIPSYGYDCKRWKQSLLDWCGQIPRIVDTVVNSMVVDNGLRRDESGWNSLRACVTMYPGQSDPFVQLDKVLDAALQMQYREALPACAARLCRFGSSSNSAAVERDVLLMSRVGEMISKNCGNEDARSAILSVVDSILVHYVPRYADSHGQVVSDVLSAVAYCTVAQDEADDDYLAYLDAWLALWDILGESQEKVRKTILPIFAPYAQWILADIVSKRINPVVRSSWSHLLEPGAEFSQSEFDFRSRCLNFVSQTSILCPNLVMTYLLKAATEGFSSLSVIYNRDAAAIAVREVMELDIVIACVDVSVSSLSQVLPDESPILVSLTQCLIGVVQLGVSVELSNNLIADAISSLIGCTSCIAQWVLEVQSVERSIAPPLQNVCLQLFGSVIDNPKFDSRVLVAAANFLYGLEQSISSVCWNDSLPFIRNWTESCLLDASKSPDVVVPLSAMFVHAATHSSNTEYRQIALSVLTGVVQPVIELQSLSQTMSPTDMRTKLSESSTLALIERRSCIFRQLIEKLEFSCKSFWAGLGASVISAFSLCVLQIVDVLASGDEKLTFDIESDVMNVLPVIIRVLPSSRRISLLEGVVEYMSLYLRSPYSAVAYRRRKLIQHCWSVCIIAASRPTESEAVLENVLDLAVEPNVAVCECLPHIQEYIFVLLTHHWWKTKAQGDTNRLIKAFSQTLSGLTDRGELDVARVILENLKVLHERTLIFNNVWCYDMLLPRLVVALLVASSKPFSVALTDDISAVLYVLLSVNETKFYAEVLPAVFRESVFDYIARNAWSACFSSVREQDEITFRLEVKQSINDLRRLRQVV